MSDPNPNDLELFDLLAGDEGEYGLGDLAERIERDPELRRRYIRTMALSAHLRYLASANARQSPRMQDATIVVPPEPRSSIYRWAAALAVAALLAMAATAFVLVPRGSDEPDERDRPTGPALAVLVAADRVGWSDDPVNPGDEVRAQRLVTDGGSYTIDLLSGATVSVTGPADLTIASFDRCVLRRGRLEANVPENAVGFTVDAPHGVRIVDLGTAFTVAVDDAGQSTVDVTEGRVRIERIGADGAAVRSRVASRGDRLIADASDWRYEPAAGVLPGTIDRVDRREGYVVRATQSFGTPADLPVQPADDDVIRGVRGESSTGYLLDRFTDGKAPADGPSSQPIWHTGKRQGEAMVQTYEFDRPIRIGSIRVFSSFTDARAFQHYDVEVHEVGEPADVWTRRFTGVTSGRIGQRFERIGKWQFDLTQIEPNEPLAAPAIDAIRFRFYPVTGYAIDPEPGAANPSADPHRPTLGINEFTEPERGLHHSGVYEIDVFGAAQPPETNGGGATPND